MRKLKLIITFLLVTIMSLTAFTGCGKEENPNSSSVENQNNSSTGGDDFLPDEAPIKKQYSTVWTAPSTLKVLRDDYIPEDAKSNLNISLAGGEAESGQIIITAEEGVEITHYSVKTNDLKSGNNVLEAKNIEIYIEKYIEITNATTIHNPTGWYPDAIVPYELVKNANELNFNKEYFADNQGIWVTVNAPRGQKAGVYKGTIDLVVEEENFSVPVAVKVYDFDINEVIHAETAFAIWDDGKRGMLESGYGIKPGDKRKNEIAKAEYEFLASKKIAATNLPVGTFKAGDPKSFAQAVKEYGKRPEISAYRIAVDAPGRVLNVNLLKSYIREIVEISIDNNKVVYDYPSKAYCYFSEIDEPNPATSDSTIYQKVKAINDGVQAAKNAIIAEINTKYKNVEGIDGLIKSVSEINHIVTADRNAGDSETPLDGNVQTFCPLFKFYNSHEYFERTEQARKERNEGAWWYGCVNPKAPYPTYHIDDNLMCIRALGWMQKEYNIEGNLYWCTNIYKKYVGNDKYSDRDVWNDPMAFPGANGDGYLTYPGVKYGIYAPIGTVRLDGVRDAQEDFEYLYMLEDLVNRVNAEKGKNIDFNGFVNELYRTLYNGVKTKLDNVNAIFEAREKVATMIEDLSNQLR